MAKYCGKLYFVEQVETTPGVWTEQETIRTYKGDLKNNTVRWSPTGSLHDNLVFSEIHISIIADTYAISKSNYLKYIDFNGFKHHIKTCLVARPRLEIYVGEISHDT